MARICLVTPSHPSSNPRLVKEADALHAAGYEVHVVAGRYYPPLDSFDTAIYRSSAWTHSVVDYSGGPRVFTRKLMRRFTIPRVARRGECTLRDAIRSRPEAIHDLAAAASSVRADLYIGHTLAGLAAAGLAAQRTGSRLGFDAEDFHPAETRAAETNLAEIASIRCIETKFLSRCVHFTAASPLIGEAYTKTYGIRKVVTLLNCFPLSESPPAPIPPERPNGLPLLYWFSQTIGPERGLESLVTALGRMRTPCALRLRGIPAAGFADVLRSLARDARFSVPIEFSPLAAPEDMVRLAASADLGLSLEQSIPLNRDLCLTNKIFTYLLAGVPVALSQTSAQRNLATSLGDSALLLDLNNPDQAAASLDSLLSSHERLAHARAAAWRLGRSRYNWENEIPSLLSSVSSALSRSP